MFNVNINNNEMIIDKELNELLNGLKIDYTQFYRGIVVDNIDPELKGRVKVRIPQIYGTDPESNVFISTDAIPWANCAVLPAGNDSGSFLPPNIGDTVYVTFESGQSSSPIYFGGILTTRVEDEEEDKKGIGSAKVFGGRIAPVNVDDLPQEVITGTERVIYKSLKGAVIYIDDKDENECIRITDQSGQSIIMENLSASMLGRRGGEVGKNPRSQIVLTNSSGDSITLTQGKIHLKSSNIIFETDNFLQIGLNELNDEISVADIILGKEEAIVTVNFIDMRTADTLSGTVSQVYLKTGSAESLIGTYQSGSDTFIELSLSSGDYRVHTTLDGYYESDIDVSVYDENPQTITVYMSRETTEDNIQIVLTWNGAISDMDSHTKIYNQGTQLGHVFYSERDYIEDGINIVNLDVDDTDYYGPETTTINKTFNYNYLFYVHRFSDGNISDSASNVKVYDKGRLIKDIDIPEGSYSSDYMYWNVLIYNCKYNRITVINEITNVEPKLENGYIDIDYVENTYRSYILPGIIMDDGANYQVELKCQPTDIENSGEGGREAWVFSTYDQGQFRVGPTLNGWVSEDSDGQITIVPDICENGTDVVITGTFNNANSTSNSPFALFTQCEYGQGPYPNRWFLGKIYYIKIWRNDTLYRDLVPKLRNQGGVTGLYDLVNDEFYEMIDFEEE